MSYSLEVREVVRLPLADTFGRLSDHNQLGPILGLPCRRTRDGQDSLNGVGSVRTLGLWPLDFDETVVVCEPDARLEYQITRGSPLRNHYGVVRFTEVPGGTEVTWTIRYDMGLPVVGAVLKQVLRLGIGRGLRGLSRR